MDLSAMTLAQLKELLQKIPAEIKRKEAKEKVIALNELKEFAQKRGFSLDELLGKEAKARGPKAGRKVAVKYRHPKDASLQWTGRGRQPKWVQDWLGNGGKIDKLKV